MKKVLKWLKSPATINVFIGVGRLLLAFAAIILLLHLISCTPQWHISQARKKDPSLFDTTITYNRFQIDPVITEPLALPKKKIDTLTFIEVQTIYNSKDTTIYDSARVDLFFRNDSVKASIDCPDPVIIDQSKTIKQKLSFWERMFDSFKLLLVIVIIYIIFKLVYKLK